MDVCNMPSTENTEVGSIKREGLAMVAGTCSSERKKNRIGVKGLDSHGNFFQGFLRIVSQVLKYKSC